MVDDAAEERAVSAARMGSAALHSSRELFVAKAATRYIECALTSTEVRVAVESRRVVAAGRWGARQGVVDTRRDALTIRGKTRPLTRATTSPAQHPRLHVDQGPHLGRLCGCADRWQRQQRRRWARQGTRAMGAVGWGTRTGSVRYSAVAQLRTQAAGSAADMASPDARPTHARTRQQGRTGRQSKRRHSLDSHGPEAAKLT